MSTLRKLLNGGDPGGRRTRFHDEDDIFMGWGAFCDLPRAAFGYAVRRAGGSRKEVPWWPYQARASISGLIRKDSIVLEYGVGMSTLWLAKRAAVVYGIEDSLDWYSEVGGRAHVLRLTNLHLSLRDSTQRLDGGTHSAEFNEHFSDIAGLPDWFDFVVVDGAARWRCVEKSLPRLKPGGYLYFDNSDADKDLPYYTEPGMSREARRILLEAARQGVGTIRYFRGLAPATLYASEGMLFKKSRL